MSDSLKKLEEKVEKVLCRYDGQEQKDQFLAIVSQDARDWMQCQDCAVRFPLAHFSMEQLGAPESAKCVHCLKEELPSDKPGPALADLRAAIKDEKKLALPVDRELGRAYAGMCVKLCPSFAVELAKVLCVVGVDFCFHDLIIWEQQLNKAGTEVADAYNQVLMKHGKLPYLHKRECTCKRHGVPYTLWQAVTALASPGVDWEQNNIWLKHTFEPTINTLLKAGVDPNEEKYDENQPFNVHHLPQWLVDRAGEFGENELEAERIGQLLNMREKPPSEKSSLWSWVSCDTEMICLGFVFLTVVWYFFLRSVAEAAPEVLAEANAAGLATEL
jgi:ferredoxin